MPSASARVVPLFALLGLVAWAAQKKEEIFRADRAVHTVSAAPFSGAVPEPSVRGARIRATPEGDVLEILEQGGEWAMHRGPADCIAGLSEAVAASGRRMLVWDEYAGGDPEAGASYDVVGSIAEPGADYRAPVLIAGGPRFQARASVAAASNGTFYLTWEEGSDGWGAEFRSVDRQWNNATDLRGPLHSWRAVRFAEIGQGGTLTEYDVPMASFDLQGANPERRPGAARIGVFYERPFVHVDDSDTAWLAYRHMHQSEAGCLVPKLTTHIERGFHIDVRSFRQGAFGPMIRIEERQRDGEQRAVFAAPEIAGSGAAENAAAVVVFEAGRQDRRKDAQHVGAMMAQLVAVQADELESRAASRSRSRSHSLRAASAPSPRPPANTTFEDASGAPYTLAFGDLHRHTDLSLCFPFFDGTIDDAYRYARGPGALDFLALTDHARDLDQGRGGSRPWQLTVAAADRHHQPGRFTAFRSYERSQGDTDHNVVSLRDDADFLRPHRPPLTEFWAEFEASSLLTIPHATSHQPGARFCGDVWQKRDDLRRPIAEIYQGMRDVSSMEELQRAALANGQKLGFIASSDHLSTRAAYACVWAEGAPAQAIDREPIFRALKQRRCYGATARIELRVRSGEHWMGEDLAPDATHVIEIDVRGTAPIERIDLWSNGERVDSIEPASSRGAPLQKVAESWSWKAGSGPGYLFVHVIQEDGHQAWSSPFFTAWPSDR